MVRYLLDRGISVGGYEIKEALRAQSIPALEMLREHGWKDVNMNLGEGGAIGLHGVGVGSLLTFSFFNFPPPPSLQFLPCNQDGLS